MNIAVKGVIRRIAYNPYPASPLHSNSTVVFYLEGDAKRYVVGTIAKGLAEAILLSAKGDFIEAQLSKPPEARFSNGMRADTWVNLSFESEQAALLSRDNEGPSND